MNISVIGTGYVGLVTGACFSEIGDNVLCMDTDTQKIDCLRKCISPIYEPGLEDILRRNLGKTLNFTTDADEAVKHGSIIFIAVGTPVLADNTPDLEYIFQAVKSIALNMEDYKLIVNKSTVPIGTCRRVKKEMETVLRDQGKDLKFDIVSNPEFLREGNAVSDFASPERIIIGSDNPKAAALIKQLYYPFIQEGVPVILTNTETAEMIKYASNAFLAAKISFINEISNMCERCNADITVVSKAMGMDSRIGNKFLNPGPGFGGSCFPKDLKALLSIGRQIGYTPLIIKSVITVNNNQGKLMFKKIKKELKRLKGKNITVLGTAFKPETDDIRESPSISIIRMLIEKQAKVKVFDPKAMANMKRLYPDLEVEYCTDVYSACRGTDCIVLATEWEQFLNLDLLKLRKLVRTPVFIDLRNAYNPGYVRYSGFIYQGVGRK